MEGRLLGFGIATGLKGTGRGPFEGSKLELGSTAKLRSLATYLEIVAELRTQLVDGKERMPELAAELGALKPRVIVTLGDGARITHAAFPEIPLVFTSFAASPAKARQRSATALWKPPGPSSAIVVAT